MIDRQLRRINVKRQRSASTTREARRQWISPKRITRPETIVAENMVGAMLRKPMAAVCVTVAPTETAHMAGFKQNRIPVRS